MRSMPARAVARMRTGSSGMNATRAYTIRYNVLLSIGRVQTPTLSMLVKRRREIDAFVPKPFYTVRADFGDYQGVYIDKKGERKLENEEAAQIARRVSGRSAQVTQSTKEHKSVPPLSWRFDDAPTRGERSTGLYREKDAGDGAKALRAAQAADLSEDGQAAPSSHDMLGKVCTIDAGKIRRRVEAHRRTGAAYGRGG